MIKEVSHKIAKKDSKKLNSILSEYNLSNKEFFSFETNYNVKLNGWMIKPKDFDPNKKYPVLMYVLWRARKSASFR